MMMMMIKVAPMLATCRPICLNGSLLDQLSSTIVYLHNLFTCTFGRINMSVCLSVCFPRRRTLTKALPDGCITTDDEQPIAVRTIYDSTADDSAKHHRCNHKSDARSLLCTHYS